MKLNSKQSKVSRNVPTLNSFLNPYAPIRQHRHHLPHWQQGSVHYFVTWRMADSLPREKLADKNPPPWDLHTQVEYDERFSHTIDDWLDAGEGACPLADPYLARCVADALLHFDNVRYVMESFVIMPNHVHVLFRLIEPHRLENVVKSWKGFAAREINRHLQRHGPLWQEDYWDRMVRDEGHLLKCREYIRDNPIKAPFDARSIPLICSRKGGRAWKPDFLIRHAADRNVRPPKEA